MALFFVVSPRKAALRPRRACHGYFVAQGLQADFPCPDQLQVIVPLPWPDWTPPAAQVTVQSSTELKLTVHAPAH